MSRRRCVGVHDLPDGWPDPVDVSPLPNGRKCRVRAARRVPSGGQRSVRGADGAAVGTGPRPVPTSAGSATRAEDPGPAASRRPAGARGRRPPDDHPVFRADDRRRSASPSCPGHAGRCSGGRGPNARGPDIVLAGPGPTRTSCGMRLQGRTAFHGGPAPGRHRTGFGVLAGTGRPPDGGRRVRRPDRMRLPALGRDVGEGGPARGGGAPK